VPKKAVTMTEVTAQMNYNYNNNNYNGNNVCLLLRLTDHEQYDHEYSMSG